MEIKVREKCKECGGGGKAKQGRSLELTTVEHDFREAMRKVFADDILEGWHEEHVEDVVNELLKGLKKQGWSFETRK